MTTNRIDGPTTATTDAPSLAESFGAPFSRIIGDPPPVTIEFWDGSSIGSDGPGTLRVMRPEALRRLMWSPDELGLARAYICGDIEVDGDLATVLRVVKRGIDEAARTALTALPGLISATRVIGGLGGPPPRPPEEAVPRGVRHSLGRDRRAISHHYDVGNDFYELVLGSSMTYSCARFATPGTSLEAAQAAKHELICRKLGLADPDRGHTRLLDVGCGWGSMAIHAATHHDVDVVGVTISAEQAAYARQRVAAVGLADRVEIRLQDYRQVTDGPFDAISSVGMAEHVGEKWMTEYFQQLYGLLPAGGRVLNHAIATVGGNKLGRRSFVARYVFPDGELLDVADTARHMEHVGFEVRDVENLREHYALTLRHWFANLEQNWDAAVSLVGEARARIWLLYMAGSINGFEDAGIQVVQTLGVRLAPDGTSAMPLTRTGWD